ncbi:uncharacterized protein LOC120296180 [Eucalyptus grandis]|uniref:uncharacterized protein LOC120296180 n=1 Tax=Eucalyptus grandis TaxID=71139 RepID=UPI00192ED6F7|nr:uncharacterized protein LOC120296180 [Eucalyptus grandis]
MDLWLANFLAQNRGLPDFEQVASLLWEIWKARNHFIFRRVQKSPDQVIDSAFALASLQKRVHQKDLKGHSSWLSPNRSWQPPPLGTMKINLDGSFPTASHRGSIAGMARDHSGRLLGGITRSVSASSALETEIQALILSLHDLIQQELTDSNLLVESDSIVLVETLNRGRLPPWECRALFTECFDLLRRFSHLRVQHCRREANTLADWAAKAHGCGSLSSAWFVSPPQVMLDILCKDALAQGCFVFPT